MPVTVNRSNVSAPTSSTVSEPTRAVEDEPFLTPSVIVLSSPAPATALPSLQAFVATGRTTRGTSTVTSARSLAAGALSAVTVAVLGITVPSETTVSSGSRTPICTLFDEPAGKPTEPG